MPLLLVLTLFALLLLLLWLSTRGSDPWYRSVWRVGVALLRLLLVPLLSTVLLAWCW